MTTRKGGSKKGRTPKKRRKNTIASTADRHALYERAVQDPKTDSATLARLYKKFRKKPAKVLREDFCGTATLATEWVRAGKDRSAIGIDLDGPTLGWGQINNIKAAPRGVANRIVLHEANVLEGKGDKADITCALNFSYCCLKSRKLLLRYFKAARKCLKSDGLFVLDVLGGSETMGIDENLHDLGDFTYRWAQESFDPLTHELTCTISFRFPDGSALEPAFEYDWRLWTMPELVDVADEAGFSDVHRMWEKTDKRGDGLGVFFEPDSVENQESWWTYLVLER